MKKINELISAFIIFMVLCVVSVSATQLPVNLSVAEDFSVVSQTAITDANPSTSTYTGDFNINPYAGSFITGVSCTQMAGTIYDNNAGYTGGWDSNVSCLVTDAVNTLAVQSAMVSAYNDARGRTGTNVTELGAGDISGLTLSAGLYKWSSPVSISAVGVTLNCSGDPSGVFIMQIAQTLTLANGGTITLIDCNPANIFWQTDTSTTIGTTAVFNGNILSGTAITIQSGATLNGRAFSQTAVTMDDVTINIPTSSVPCVPNWTCSLYSTSCVADKYACLNVSDSNMCGEVFGGSLATYFNSCVTPSGGGGGYGTAITQTVQPNVTATITTETATAEPTILQKILGWFMTLWAWMKSNILATIILLIILGGFIFWMTHRK